MINKPKHMLILIIFAMLFLGNATVIYGDTVLTNPVNSASSTDNSKMINSQLDNFDFSGMNSSLSNSDDSNVNKINIKDLIIKAINGQLDLSPQTLIKNFLNSLVGEFSSITALIRNMLIIAILSSLLKNLSATFSQKSVSDMCFYVSYIAIVMILVSSFKICVDVMHGLVDTAGLFINASLPLMLTLMVLTGKVTTYQLFNGLIMFFITLITNIIKIFIAPAIIFSATLQLLNNLSEKEYLQKMCDFIKNSISWVLKTIFVLFAGILSIQGVSAPIINNVVTKTAKSALTMVPVVGQVLSGAVDSVSQWTGAIKSGAMVSIIIVIIMICIVPIIKLVAFMLVFKITAAIIQPICEDRLVVAIDAIGSFVSMLISISVGVCCMFIFMTIILMGVV